MFSYFSMISLRLPHASRTGDVKEELLCLIATLRKVGAGLMCGQPWLPKLPNLGMVQNYPLMVVNGILMVY